MSPEQARGLLRLPQLQVAREVSMSRSLIKSDGAWHRAIHLWSERGSVNHFWIARLVSRSQNRE